MVASNDRVQTILYSLRQPTRGHCAVMFRHILNCFRVSGCKSSANPHNIKFNSNHDNHGFQDEMSIDNNLMQLAFSLCAEERVTVPGGRREERKMMFLPALSPLCIPLLTLTSLSLRSASHLTLHPRGPAGRNNRISLSGGPLSAINPVSHAATVCPCLSHSFAPSLHPSLRTLPAGLYLHPSLPKSIPPFLPTLLPVILGLAPSSHRSLPLLLPLRGPRDAAFVCLKIGRAHV